jgi:hypothetical protein
MDSGQIGSSQEGVEKESLPLSTDELISNKFEKKFVDNKNRDKINNRITARTLIEVVKNEIRDGRESRFGRIFRRLAKSLESEQEEDSTQVIKTLISRIVARMKRQNTWRRFSGVGKGILTLCVRLPIRFKGELLLRNLLKIIKESFYLLSPLFRYWADGVGLAHKMSETAQKWGNKDAHRWKDDDSYAIHLGMSRSYGFAVRAV